MAASSSSGDGGSMLAKVSDDDLINIFSAMEDDARHLATVSCVCRRFHNLVRNICWKNHCMRDLPAIVPELVLPKCQHELGEPPAGWASLFRLLVVCPGLLRNTGETWDLGLERDIGNSDQFNNLDSKRRKVASETSGTNAGNIHQHVSPHLASGARIFSRELGNKLLASRFRTDSLYMCDYPGCVHFEELPRRKYQVFRGVFKDFKASRTYRNLCDLKAKNAEAMQCAFCLSGTLWDMVTTFCLRRSLDYHDDGEPVVRAYVCENGHVSGCWTEHY